MKAARLARRTLLLAALAATGAAGAAHAGEDDGLVEYQVKAAFVCKFGNVDVRRVASTDDHCYVAGR